MYNKFILGDVEITTAKICKYLKVMKHHMGNKYLRRAKRGNYFYCNNYRSLALVGKQFEVSVMKRHFNYNKPAH